MNYSPSIKLKSFYDISLILIVGNIDLIPILKENATSFLQNELEIILIFDDCDVLKNYQVFVEEYTFVNWIFVLSTNRKIQNDQLELYGLRVASKKYAILTSACPIYTEESIAQARFLIEYYKNSYIIQKQNENQNSTIYFKVNDTFDFLMAEKDLLLSFFLQNNEYNHHLDFYGNLLLHLDSRYARRIYSYNSTDPIFRALNDNASSSVYKSKSLHRKKTFRDWNFSVDENYIIIYDYKNKSFLQPLFSTYLKTFSKYFIINREALIRKHRIVALIQTYNERDNIESVLSNIATKCDGIILLDDGSTDGTYEAAINEKILIKVKKNRDRFNDIKNRNTLLDLSYFINVDWLFFIDADEHFDNRYSDLYSIVAKSNQLVISFWIVNLWNDDRFFRKDLEDSGLHSHNGLWSRPRLFRSYGCRQQIVLLSNDKLHFPTTPYPYDPKPDKILLLHYGIKSLSLRKSKYQFYLKEDVDNFRNTEQYYSYLLDENVETNLVENISL